MAVSFKTKQEQFNKEANQRAEKFLENILLPTLKKDLSEYFNIEADVYIDAEDPQTINFRYPQLFSYPSILHVVRLEIGAACGGSPQLCSFNLCGRTVPKYFKSRQ